jgi:PAS domain-containing protein
VLLPNLTALALVLGTGCVVLLRQPFSPLRRPLLAAHAAALLFVLGDVGTLAAGDLRTKQLSLLVLYTGIVWIPPTWWWLATRIAASHRRPVPGGALAVRAPIIAAAALWLLAVTNPLHGQFVTPVVAGRNEHHWGWALGVAVSYAIILAVCALYVALAMRAPRRSRRRAQATLLGFATLVPLAANALYTLTPWPWLADPTVTGLALTSALLAIGIYGTRLFGLSPVSLREVIRHESSGVLLLDLEGRLCFANDAARSLLGVALEPECPAVTTLASRLRSADGDEPVPASELWGQVRKPDRHGSGALYRMSGADARWLWISATPVPSRWRAVAAWCFRVEDVTRLHQAERARARLEQRLRRRLGPRTEAERRRALDRPLERIDAVVDYGLLLASADLPDPDLLADCFRAIRREIHLGRLQRGDADGS